MTFQTYKMLSETYAVANVDSVSEIPKTIANEREVFLLPPKNGAYRIVARTDGENVPFPIDAGLVAAYEIYRLTGETHPTICFSDGIHRFAIFESEEGGHSVGVDIGIPELLGNPYMPMHAYELNGYTEFGETLKLTDTYFDIFFLPDLYAEYIDDMVTAWSRSEYDGDYLLLAAITGRNRYSVRAFDRRHGEIGTCLTALISYVTFYNGHSDAKKSIVRTSRGEMLATTHVDFYVTACAGIEISDPS